MFEVKPVVLEGRVVRLEPLGMEHAAGLERALEDEELFRWFPTRMNAAEGVAEWISAAHEERDRGVSLPFATVLRETGEAIGSTRFSAIDRKNLRAEIGWTFLLRPWQRTGANREAKYLMLRHAMEEWKLRRVEFKTHASNVQSRTALARLGAQEEGTLRKHMVMPDGSARDSVYYSILDTEWAAVKSRLETQLRARELDR